MAEAVVHQSQQRDAEKDTGRELKHELEPGDTVTTDPTDETEASASDTADAAGESPDDAVGGTPGDPDGPTGETTADVNGAGIALRRLLAVATLTPAQAGLLAMDLVDTLVTLDERGQCPDQVNDRSVLVMRDGTVTIAPAPETAGSETAPEAADTDDTASGTAGDTNGRATRGVEQLPVAATTANSLVRLLIDHTRGGSARRKVDATLLTDRLAGSCAELTALRDKVHAAVAELATGDDATWDDWTSRTRRQITALVTATQGRTALRDRAPVRPAPLDDAEATNAVATSARALNLARGDLRGARRKAWYRKRRLPGRKTVLITLIVALVAAAGWWAVPRTWSELRRGWEAVFTTSEPSQQLPPLAPPEEQGSGGEITGKSTGTSTDAARPASNDSKPGPVPRLAPKAAGPITGVSIERAEGECRRNAICPVRVDVRLGPSASPREVGWSLRVVDRCTGKIGKRKGVTMTAEAGWQQVYGISRPKLSGSRALAIIAVTKTPAKTASAPLLVTADRATC